MQIYKVIVAYVLSNGDEKAIKNELEEIQLFLNENIIFKRLYTDNISENKKNNVNNYFKNLQLSKNSDEFKNRSQECVKVLLIIFAMLKMILLGKD